MITLIEAFRLCDIKDEHVYLHPEKDKGAFDSYGIWSEKIREKIDMRKAKVVKIRPHFSYEGYEGVEFFIRGMSVEEIRKLYYS